MKFNGFKDIENYILSSGIRKTVALANAQDDVALGALIHAKRAGVVNAILVGDSDKIKKLLINEKENPVDYEIIESADEREAADIACGLVRDGKADIPMKGLMQTSNFMKAILNKEMGFFPKGNILSQATVLEYKEENRLMIITDCAVNITPDVDAKEKITANAVKLAHKLGIEKPNIAFLSAVEKINPKIQSTLDADELTKRALNGCFEGIGEAYGPMALDNAISEEAARHKGIVSKVAGHADILVVPDLCSGNIFTKGLTFFAHMESAGTLNGSDIPVIMTSRTDTLEDKYYSILVAVMQSL